MEYQIVIYSADTVFARMLELEFSMREMSVLTVRQPREDLFSEVAILDLDSSAAPAPTSYRRMIGFTRGAALAEDDARRQCSMILHRPFEMRLLRREVLGGIGMGQPSREAEPHSVELTLDAEHDILCVNRQFIALTPHEACVMRLLLEASGEPVSRERIAEEIGESSANKVDVYICYLRRKLEQVTGLRVIRTVRGKGYCVTF